MARTEYTQYHPWAEQLWSTILVRPDGAHFLPEAIERVARLRLGWLGDGRELRWLEASIHSLYAAMARQGHEQAAHALRRLANHAAQLAGQFESTYDRSEPGEAGNLPRLAPAIDAPRRGVPLASLLPLGRIRP